MLGPLVPVGSPLANAVTAIGVAAAAAVRRLGPRPAWHVASVHYSFAVFDATSVTRDTEKRLGELVTGFVCASAAPPAAIQQ